MPAGEASGFAGDVFKPVDCVLRQERGEIVNGAFLAMKSAVNFAIACTKSART